MAWIDELSLEAKLGQLLMVGFDGTEFSPGLRRFCQKYRPGGVILFERNFVNRQQLTRLCSDLQNWALEQSPPIPLLIATDHEGGRVQRFKEDFIPLPPAGTISSPEQAYWLGKLMGTELKAAGINMNMAPVLDVNSNSNNPIIGERSLGNNPQRVIQLALPLIKGMQEEGVIAVGKHFPGHGQTDLDSHQTLPTVAAEKKILQQRELPPFKAAIAANLSAVMTAHVLYPAWDESNPATLSPFILNKLLRQKMGFDGIIVSDDLLMGALKDAGIGSVACRSLLAGVDLLLVGTQPDSQVLVLESLQTARESGALSVRRLEESLRRLFKLKAQYLGEG
jgi:beta-N-acetylhexosaminidase